MEIWLDTCDTQAIKKAQQFGIIYGITTNPSLLANEKEHYEKVITNLLELQDGPLAVQITAEETDDIIQRAKALHTFSTRIIVKIPVTEKGLIAIKALAENEIPVMATVIFQPRQALLAALAGAAYIAPYLGRMFDAGLDAYASLQSMLTIYKQHGLKTKILAAAVRTPEQIVTCAEMGINAVTLKSSLFNQLIVDDPLTEDSLRIFGDDWEARNYQLASDLVL